MDYFEAYATRVYRLTNKIGLGVNRIIDNCGAPTPWEIY